MNNPSTDSAFTEIPVAAGILHATADLIDVLGEFLTTADPTVKAQLGTYLINHRDIVTTKNPTLAATIMLTDLDEAADLLHTLADSARHTP